MTVSRCPRGARGRRPISAWIVSRARIDVLVQELCEGEHVTYLNPDEVGRVL
ncbi:hypothetical protein GCM10023328_47710 [Modestobacter marinus]|uniref:Uncharacterized protein n=1 Tax=Modestobacter marinus TaxID=477641 RepID=A0ABQ2GBA5_9ACTN|nr:hypothetical protein GCM10011589_45220 [Modestobacter marinus]